MDCRSSRLAMRRPSLPVGATMMVRRSCPETTISGSRGGLRLRRFADKAGHASKHSLKVFQRLPDVDCTLTEDKFADGPFVRAASLLNHRKRLADLSQIFEVAEEQYSIGEITHVNRGLHSADEAVLSQRENGSDPLLAEI